MEGAFSSKDEALAFIKKKAEVARGAFMEKHGFCGDFDEKNLSLPCSYIPQNYYMWQITEFDEDDPKTRIIFALDEEDI